MPGMDKLTFMTFKTTRANVMSATLFEKIPFEEGLARHRRLIEKIPKLRYKIV